MAPRTGSGRVPTRLPDGQAQRRRAGGSPHPGCFGKRGCKLLKTKDRSRKKRVKRPQEIDRSIVRGGAAGRVREGSPQQHAQSYYKSGRLYVKIFLLLSTSLRGLLHHSNPRRCEINWVESEQAA